ncbi:MAG: PaaI family thioesterase, partial [Sphingomonas sp.]|nr:PaaI family thioesterase [Sphingomonas sp.]
LLEFAAFTTLARAIGDTVVGMKPITVTVDYLRGGGGHDTFASARIQRLGNRMANVEAKAWQNDRATPIATARLNFLLERPGAPA